MKVKLPRRLNLIETETFQVVASARKGGQRQRERESDHGEVKSKMGAQPLKRYIWNTYVLYTHSQIAGGLRYRVRKKMCTHTHKHIHQTHDKEVTSVLAHLFHFKGGISLTRCNSRTHSTDVYDSISK